MKKLFFLLLLAGASPAAAQNDRIDLIVKFLSNEDLGDVNFEREAFLNYAKAFVDTLKGHTFVNYTEGQDILIQQTFHTSRAPTYQVFSRPALSKEKEAALIQKLGAIPPVHSKITDYHLLYDLALNGGAADRKTPYVPAYSPPAKLEEEKLKSADLKGKYDLIRAWAIEEIIPLLAAFEKSADPKFEGVTGLGQLLGSTDWKQKQDIARHTDKNFTYWRAVVEMSPGNQLIPASRIFMYVAQGEFDRAKSWAEFTSYFSSKKSVPYFLLQELDWRLDIFYEQLHGEINKGIAQHDAGNYADAIATYEKIVAAYPWSAWANYELYYSRNAKSVKDGTSKLEDFSAWNEAKKLIYYCDPLYQTDVHAGTGKEGYRLFRRQELGTLFRKKSEFTKDLITYADIAMDLDDYGTAAQVYWMIISSIPEEEYKGTNMVFRFLYALDKLGDTEIKKNFKGNFEKEFRDIDKERDKAMKKSAIYNSFEKKE